jgi:hypothetical protein
LFASWTGTNVVTGTKLDESSTPVLVTVLDPPDQWDRWDPWDPWDPQDLPALAAPPEHKVRLAPQDQPARLELRVRQVLPDPQGPPELSDQPDPPALSDQQDPQDQQALPDRQDQLDPKADLGPRDQRVTWDRQDQLDQQGRLEL